MTKPEPGGAAQGQGSPGGVRLDKWLWYARFFKTRSLATKLVSAGHVRVNGQKVSKPARLVGPGDTLTFPQARAVRVIRVVALGERRGPAPEAQALYEDLQPVDERPTLQPSTPRYDGGGRPGKKERRNAALSKRDTLE